jgi:Glycosyltransferase family 87
LPVRPSDPSFPSFLMTNPQRWAGSFLLLAAAAASLIGFGLVGIGREQNFSFDYQVMHLGGLIWRDGRNPYDLKQLNATYAEFNDRPSDHSPKLSLYPPFSYPPHSAALFVPFSLLSLSTAMYVWWVLSLVALACIVAMALVSLRHGPGGLSDPLSWSVPVAIIVGNPITTHVFWQGQTSLIAFAASMGGWFFSRRGNWQLAGVCLALGSIKPQLCLFIVLWLLLERNWKALIVAALTGTVMSAYPMLVHGPIGAVTDWLERLQAHKAFGPNTPGFEHVVGLQSLVAACGLPAPPMEPVGIVAVIGLWFARKRFTSDDLLGLLMGLTVTFVFVHDAEYVALFPLFTALWIHFREEPSNGPLLFLLGALFLLPRRFVRELDVPVLCHWRTLVALVLLLMLLIVALRQPARRQLQAA